MKLNVLRDRVRKDRMRQVRLGDNRGDPDDSLLAITHCFRRSNLRSVYHRGRVLLLQDLAAINNPYEKSPSPRYDTAYKS